mmetsp:Transcript_23409/g.40011  ORF Transcript_23409/g.40011 Transcript_23409/m.40011 type:complete len:138 (-) Transcript_23409:274-687(-)
MPPKTDGPSMTVISTEEEWAKVSGESAEKDMLFMVEVFANWCGPSEAITSTMKKLSGDYNGKKLKFMQINADVVDMFQKQRTQSRPYFVFFKEGEHIEAVEGVNAPAIEKLIMDHIPEGMVDTAEDDAAGDGDEDDE